MQPTTSALFSGPLIDATGFGTVCLQGYGMNYMVSSQSVKIGVESKRDCVETSTAWFIQVLDGVFRDVGKLLGEGQQETQANL